MISVSQNNDSYVIILGLWLKGDFKMRAFDNHLLELLSSHNVTFFIPPYQRNYEWDKEQCEVFLHDIFETTRANRQGKNTEHFFGTVTYFQAESSAWGQPATLVLIDGQQRITTTMLFLIALRDTITDNTVADSIESDFLKNKKVADNSEYKIKLKQVESDWAIYCDIILQNEIPEKKKLSAVYRNYAYFCRELTRLKETNNLNLTDLINLGLMKFSVVTIELEPIRNKWENPQEIFESMNSLGKPLSLADLVRNYLLLGKTPTKQNTLYKKYWMQIEEQLPNQTSNFIRDYMQLKGNKSFKQATEKNYKELYANFKELFKNTEIEVLLSELSEYSFIYSCIVLGTDCGSKEINHQIADIKTIGATTTYSFIMELIHRWKQKKFTDKDLSDILDVLIIYLIRRRIVSLTMAENKVFPTLISKIDDVEKALDKKNSTFDIFAKQENSLRLPNDVEMKRIMQSMNFYNFRLAKFLFSLVEEKITKARPNKNDSNLQVEHIMPQTLDKAGKWQIDLGADYENIHQEYINNIGNLTLIRQNQELGNKSFSAKKVIYENNAGLQIAKTKITDQAYWNKESIINRQNWIIDYILSNILPIPDKMRRINNFVISGGKRLSFLELQIIGQNINYISDKSIVAKIIDDKKVEYEGTEWFLTTLTREIETRKGTVNASGAYQGAQYWEYDGVKLADIM